LAFPADFYLATTTPVTFRWTYFDPCAAQSFVVVVTDVDGAVVASASVGGTGWTSPRFVPGNTFFWKVAAVHDGVQGPFSVTRRFVVTG